MALGQTYHSAIILLSLFFSVSGHSYKLCVQHSTTAPCKQYLDVRNALNLSPEFTRVEQMMSCFRKCGSPRQELNSYCFCDTLCKYFSDCCVDYDIWCKNHQISVNTNLTCRYVHGDALKGYLMIDSCQSTWKNKYIQKKCKEDSKDLLTSLPVTDGISQTIYKNIFCGICNHARNLRYWKIEFLDGMVDLAKNITFKEVLTKSSRFKFVNPEIYTKNERYCTPRYTGCNNETSLSFLLHMSRSELQSICNSYSFPVVECLAFEKNRFRNFHCMICEGKWFNGSKICMHSENRIAGFLSSQTIVFDFIAHGSSSESHNKYKTKVISYRCDGQSVYDPFLEKCQSINNELKNKTKGKIQKFHHNSSCLEQPENSSQNASILSNGSIILNGKVHNDLHLKVIGNRSIICGNNTISTIVLRPRGIRKGPSKLALRAITTIGFTLSSACLLFLLFTYTIYSDLRTTPGKCIMSLSCALLLYMACHVSLTSTSYQILCVGNAIVLHYSLLALFAWLSVLGFDISKRFGNQAIERRTSRSYKTARNPCDVMFLKYCLYSWGMPLTIVLICIVLDVTDTIKFRYGQGQYCFISTTIGVITAVISPVAAILLFNVTGLIRTILGIKKMKKDTSVAIQDSSRPCSALLYLKLSCLFGLTWILNIVFAFTQTTSIEYVTVSLNSCQGIFICVAFCFNKRVLNFYKTKLGVDSNSKYFHRFKRSKTGIT